MMAGVIIFALGTWFGMLLGAVMAAVEMEEE